MTAPLRILMPLRVPELAPPLGRLIVPRRLEAPWVLLDDVREGLATDIILLAGEARRAGAREARDNVLTTLGAANWRMAWEKAVRTVAERVGDQLDAAIERAAWRVRMPRRRWRKRLITGNERRAIAARLSYGGGPLIQALETLDAAADAARAASVTDHDALQQWQQALNASARRLEAAWLALEEAVAAERARWEGELEEILAWRRSRWPVVILWVPCFAVLVWLGLVLGGYLDGPSWLAERLGF